MKILKPKSQKQRILEALQECDCPNWWFPVRMSILKYTNRISELRRDGYEIGTYKLNEGGTVWYHLDNSKMNA